MDRRTLLAIAICLAILIFYPVLLRLLGLERYTRKSDPPREAPTAVDTTASSSPRDTARSTAPPSPPEAARTPSLASTPFTPERSELERTVVVETPLYRAHFSNRGARLVSLELKHYASAHGESRQAGRPVRLHGDEPLPSADRVVLAGGPSLAVDLGSPSNQHSLADIVYAVRESLDAAGNTRVLTFETRTSGGMSIRHTWRTRPDDYALDLDVELRSIPASLRLEDYSVTARSWPLLHENAPDDEVRSLRATSLVGTNLHREAPGGLRKAPKVFEGNVAWVAVQTRYFMGAVVVAEGTARAAVSRAETRPLTPEERKLFPADQRPEQEVAINTLVMRLPGETDPVDRFFVYFGPNEYSRVAKLGSGLFRLVDLGWNWILPFSKALLQLLNWLHRLLGNYGIAIIVIATLVRVVLHPLNMMSMKSMRAMQRLQPEMERLKAKYKNDAQALNTAVMALYKENKVNPAGGCLPMLLQMPLFFALYAVLYNAIELRQAPFVGWIDDLSAPEVLFMVGPFPVRLLPILMMLTGLLSQKLTPTDPRQASTMYLMNIVMVVFFYNLPSGLVLYWTVMNLLTALQQWLVLRDDDGGLAPAPARSPAVAKKAGAK